MRRRTLLRAAAVTAVVASLPSAWPGTTSAGPNRLAVLTPRERQVALLMTQGLTNEEIAIAFGRSRSTIRHRVTWILMKLNVPTRAAAIELVRAQATSA
jgi:DNA-binding CsgD family transcriptional regulator